MPDEWPKAWDDILYRRHKEDGDTLVSSEGWFQFTDGLRSYKGTLYASIDIGRESDENRDCWVPFERYLAQDYEDP